MHSKVQRKPEEAVRSLENAKIFTHGLSMALFPPFYLFMFVSSNRNRRAKLVRDHGGNKYSLFEFLIVEFG